MSCTPKDFKDCNSVRLRVHWPLAGCAFSFVFRLSAVSGIPFSHSASFSLSLSHQYHYQRRFRVATKPLGFFTFEQWFQHTGTSINFYTRSLSTPSPPPHPPPHTRPRPTWCVCVASVIVIKHPHSHLVVLGALEMLILCTLTSPLYHLHSAKTAPASHDRMHQVQSYMHMYINAIKWFWSCLLPWTSK